jgi:hypothetical protein
LALVESKKRFRLIAETSPGAMFTSVIEDGMMRLSVTDTGFGIPKD